LNFDQGLITKEILQVFFIYIKNDDYFMFAVYRCGPNCPSYLFIERILSALLETGGGEDKGFYIYFLKYFLFKNILK